jgi:hypothetical protein
MKRLRTILISLALVFSFGAAVVPAAVYADAAGAACQAIGSDADCAAAPKGSVSINKIIRTVVNLLSIAVGIAAVVMLIIGGLKYITSGGDSNQISSAKSTLTYAIVGLVIAALAQFIVQFVLNKIK